MRNSNSNLKYLIKILATDFMKRTMNSNSYTNSKVVNHCTGGWGGGGGGGGIFHCASCTIARSKFCN